MRALRQRETPAPDDFARFPILSEAYRYWRCKCEARGVPRRRDIDPAEIPRLLPYLQITELVEGGRRIRFRLVGTAIVAAFGTELTGKYFDELFIDDRLRYVQETYRTVGRERRPLFLCNRYFALREAPLACRAVMMPLSEDGATVNQCLAALDFEFPGRAEQWLGQWYGNDNFDSANSYACYLD